MDELAEQIVGRFLSLSFQLDFEVLEHVVKPRKGDKPLLVGHDRIDRTGDALSPPPELRVIFFRYAKDGGEDLNRQGIDELFDDIERDARFCSGGEIGKGPVDELCDHRSKGHDRFRAKRRSHQSAQPCMRGIVLQDDRLRCPRTGVSVLDHSFNERSLCGVFEHHRASRIFEQVRHVVISRDEPPRQEF